MAVTGTYPPVVTSNEVSTGTAEAANFIPELWSSEIIADYKSNLVVGNHVTTFAHNGQKGDTFHIPAPIRLYQGPMATTPATGATATASYTPITLTANDELKVDISLNKFFHSARMIEDTASVQMLDTYRPFLVEDMAYSLAAQVDQDLHRLGSGLQGGGAYPLYLSAVIGGDGSTTWLPATSGNGTALSDAGRMAPLH